MRLFVAFPIPEDVSGTLEETLNPLQKELKRLLGRSLKWVPQENYHITLKFLGETSQGVYENFLAPLERLSRNLPSFETGFEEIGFFPLIGFPKVMWLSLDFPENVFDFQRKMESFFERFGYRREQREFVPHMTLARFSKLKPSQVREMRELVSSFMEKNLQEIRIRFSIDRLVLYRSDLSPQGPTYTPVKIFSL